MNNDNMLTIKEASEYLNINTKTIYRLLHNNDLKGYKVGRVWRLKKKDIDKYLEKNKNKN